jgi:hypothetical protein
MADNVAHEAAGIQTGAVAMSRARRHFVCKRGMQSPSHRIIYRNVKGLNKSARNMKHFLVSVRLATNDFDKYFLNVNAIILCSLIYHSTECCGLDWSGSR